LQASVFLELVTNLGPSDLMSDIHAETFGKTIDERKAGSLIAWDSVGIDYSQYDHPIYESKRS